VVALASCGPGLSPLLGVRDAAVEQHTSGDDSAGADALDAADSADVRDPPHVPDASDVSDGAATDQGADGADAGDHPSAVTCDTSMPFGSPIAVPGLDTVGGSASCVRLSADELWATLTIDVFGRGDLFAASRTSRGQALESLAALTSLNTAYTDTCLTTSADRLTAYFESDRSNGFALWTATRAPTADPFGPPMSVDELNVYGEGGAYLAAGDRALYFHSWRATVPDGPELPNLYRVERLAGGGFGPGDSPYQPQHPRQRVCARRHPRRIDDLLRAGQQLIQPKRAQHLHGHPHVGGGALRHRGPRRRAQHGRRRVPELDLPGQLPPLLPPHRPGGQHADPPTRQLVPRRHRRRRQPRLHLRPRRGNGVILIAAAVSLREKSRTLQWHADFSNTGTPALLDSQSCRCRSMR
jgi:hypothetical protein